MEKYVGPIVLGFCWGVLLGMAFFTAKGDQVHIVLLVLLAFTLLSYEMVREEFNL